MRILLLGLFLSLPAWATLTQSGSNATALQGFPISTSAPSTAECLVWSGSVYAPAACGGGGVTTGNLTSATTGLSVSNGTDAVVGGGTSLSIQTASGSQPGLLSAADWTTFNGKQSALSLGNLTTSTTGLTITGGTGAVVGAATVNVQTASGSQPGLLSAADWTTFNAKLTSPLTTLGDIMYGGAAGAATRLAGNTTTTQKFLTQTGTGSVSAAPGWNTIANSDLPNNGAGITQEWIPVTTDGSGGMHLSNATGNSYVCAQSSKFGTGKFTCIQEVTGTGGQIVLGGATHLWSPEGSIGLILSNGNFAGTQYFSVDSASNIVFQGDLNNEFYNFWTGKAPGNTGFGQGFNKTALNVNPSSSATIFDWTPDNIISEIAMEFQCQGGSSTASDYWFFNRQFHLIATGVSGNTHTGWSEIDSGAGVAVVPDRMSAGLAGSTITMATSGLRITAAINNASGSLTGRITCEIEDHNGHVQP